MWWWWGCCMSSSEMNSAHSRKDSSFVNFLCFWLLVCKLISQVEIRGREMFISLTIYMENLPCSFQLQKKQEREHVCHFFMKAVVLTSPWVIRVHFIRVKLEFRCQVILHIRRWIDFLLSFLPRWHSIIIEDVESCEGRKEGNDGDDDDDDSDFLPSSSVGSSLSWMSMWLMVMNGLRPFESLLEMMKFLFQES